MSTQLVTLLIQLRPAALVTTALTVIAYLVMLLRMGKLTIRCETHRDTALFAGLGGRSLIHMAIVWVKFAFFAAVLLLAHTPVRMEHWLLLLLSVLALLLYPSVYMLVSELTGTVIMQFGLTVGGLLLRYIRQVHRGGMMAVYWLLAAFLIVAAFAVLIRECIVISGERKYFDETGETE